MEREAGALPSELEPGSAACRVTLGQAGSLRSQCLSWGVGVTAPWQGRGEECGSPGAGSAAFPSFAPLTPASPSILPPTSHLSPLVIKKNILKCDKCTGE